MADKEEQTTIRSSISQLQSLYDLMIEEELEFLEFKEKDIKVRLNRRWAQEASHGHGPVRHSSPLLNPVGPAVPAVEPPAASGNGIQAPLAGIFYRASSPTTPPFAKEGDVVEAGQTLCIIEAMKVMNEIKAESRARITRIAVENGRPVTSGQVLFEVENA